MTGNPPERTLRSVMSDAPEETTAPRTSRARGAAVAVLLIAGTLLMVGAGIGIWAQRQALDTDEWVDTSAGLLENEQIRTAVGLYLVDRLYDSEEVQQRLEEVLPPRLQPLAAPAAAGLKEVARRNAPRLLGTAVALDAWRDANRAAHETLLSAIDGADVPVDWVVGALAEAPNAHAVADDVWSIATSLMVSVAEGGMLLGLIVVAGAWLAGPGRRATKVRQAGGPTFARRPAVLRVSLALLLLLLVLWGPVPWTEQVLPLVLLTAAAYLWLELLIRRTVADLRPVPAAD